MPPSKRPAWPPPEPIRPLRLTLSLAEARLLMQWGDVFIGIMDQLADGPTMDRSVKMYTRMQPSTGLAVRLSSLMVDYAESKRQRPPRFTRAHPLIPVDRD